MNSEPSGRGSLRHRLSATVSSLSRTGKLVFYTLAVVFCFSGLSLAAKANDQFMVEVPKHGGTFTEGVVGVPRYVNPVLAVTEADKDLSALVYSGLMRRMPDGSIVPDLAEGYSTSTDGLSYTFTLRQGARFHDGSPVTADDVVFTISRAQDPAVKSPRRALWEGVVAEKADDRTVRFTLPQPYSTFLQNATLGILPKKLWNDESGDAFALATGNAEPVGSGPYKLKKIEKGANGSPSAYALAANKEFALGRPYISTIVVRFYPTDKALLEAYRAGVVGAMSGVSPDTASELAAGGASVRTALLPRVFGVFFNQESNQALSELAVRNALDMAADREYIVRTVLHGYGAPLRDPAPAGFAGTSLASSTSVSRDEAVAAAKALLEKNGWTAGADGIREKKLKNGTTVRLAFAISTSDASELGEVAEALKAEWREIGADVDIKVFEAGYLNQNAIRPRKYDALLFGEIVNRETDLYAFWHSSQKADPGLNVAMYGSAAADKALESLRSASTAADRAKAYDSLRGAIADDVPASFLYAPSFVYVVPKSIGGLAVSGISSSAERWNGVYAWHAETDKVWKIFVNN